MLTVSLLLTLGCTSAPEPESDAAAAKPVAETVAPILESSDPNGIEPMDVAALKALIESPHPRHRVVNFWATWCGPCIEELPRFRDWARGQDRADLVLVNVDLAQVRERLVLPFLAKQDLQTFHNVHFEDRDPASGLQKALPEFSGILPFTLVVEPEGGQNRTVLLGSVHTDQLDEVLDRD